MNFVFVSYVYALDFSSPESWLKRIEIYSGIYEHLSSLSPLHSIQQIDYKGNFEQKNVHYHFVNFGKPLKYFPWKLNTYVASLHPDIVVVHGLHQPLQLIQLRLKLSKKTKIIVQHHAERPFTGIKKYAQRLADHFTDAYLFASLDLGADWIKKGNLTTLAKIHEVMEVSSVFYPLEKSAAKLKTGVAGNPVFLWVGRLNENKNPLHVINAFLDFVTVEPAATLYMIYPTNELLETIEGVLKDHVNKDAVVLVGKIPHGELLYWFNSADFILSGSYYEGSGTAICEAMSCGCIPIVTDIFSFRMITAGGTCGLLYEAGNEQALLTALMKTREMNVNEKRHLCIAYFKSHLSFEAIARKIYEIAGSLK